MNQLPAHPVLVAIVISCVLSCTADGMTARDLDWSELMPPWDDPEPEPPGAMVLHPAYEVFYEPVTELDRQLVRLPGYVVPLESDAGGLLDEFLLVPFFGACIHVPPPPPNQLVYVRLSRPFYLRSMEDPYWVTGTLHVQQWAGNFADALYTMEGQTMEPFR